ncbi:hypothetical protein C5B96_11095 [Subtercola sp. Z020]|uniref:hypothetical protein n=1 Tax=Subtercola sp. Z020 TaxID=2080582 RepID=UPI000CE75E0C|nr:hypothetical protein [Subtercola sp. Z020]PPF80278.1 hypothetical protein C5B96_11095 [Subtercola sp. Z020]
MNTAPALPRPTGAGPSAAAGAVAPAAVAPAAVAADATAVAATPATSVTAGDVDPASLAPIDRAVLALGTALVSWSRRAERRGAAHPEPALAPDTATDLAATAATHTSAAAAQLAADAATRERHDLRRAAVAARAGILAERDLGINRLLR